MSNKKINQKQWLKQRYQNSLTAKYYIIDRFSEPLWRMVHQKQIDFINNFFKETKPKNILDLATGPARIARDLKYFKKGWAADLGPEMLKQARHNLNSNKWLIKKADAFNLKLKEKFEAVTCFRFLRHFDLKNRQKIYEQIKKVLQPGRYLIFEALNREIKRGSYIEKFTGAWDQTIKDEVYNLPQLKKELGVAGFKLIKTENILNDWESLLKQQNKFLKAKMPAKKVAAKLRKLDERDKKNNFLWITLWQLKK